jgi:hypothetical protein
VEGAFGAPDSDTGKVAYFLAMSALYPQSDQGQVFIFKVAQVESSVYSVYYTRLFSGEQPADMAAKIRAWLVEHLTEYAPDIGGLTADASWVAYLRAKLRDEHP